ncbi:MAG: 30S ribosomal protein S8 [DPANN group archaeon]|nr:30S ribosomal protein S8 [uncultured archaeon]MBS3065373.1 30S ribosomal protein S8 [DPANN group archaeon]
MMHDVLADMLARIKNAQVKGKTELTAQPVSKLGLSILDILKVEGYIDSYDYKDDKRGGVVTIKLNGKINGIGAVKPRYALKLDEFEKFEKRYLPAKDFGRLIISTSNGLLTHMEAKKKRKGGVLLAYVY